MNEAYRSLSVLAQPIVLCAFANKLKNWNLLLFTNERLLGNAWFLSLLLIKIQEHAVLTEEIFQILR